MADLTDTQFLNTDPDVLGLQRQRKLAELLTGQAFNQPQGQMISGRYVKPSNLQQALPMISAAIGGMTNANLDTKQTELAAALRGKQQEAVQKFVNAQTPQERFAAGTSQYAPAELQKTAYGMVTPQKLAEGETINQLNMGTGQYEPMAQGGQKIAPEVRQAMQTLGINKPLDQLLPQELQAIKKEMVQFKQAGANVMNVNMGQHGFENTLKLGENWKNEPIYKAHQEVSQAFKQVNNALDRGDAAGDLTAAIKINKMFDPTGVVRETEAARIAASRGTLDTMLQLTAKITKGESLTTTQRKQYKSLVKDFYDISGEQYNETRNKYAQIGKENQLSGTDTILGAPWKPIVTNAAPITQNMQDANKILGIPPIGGGQ